MHTLSVMYFFWIQQTFVTFRPLALNKPTQSISGSSCTYNKPPQNSRILTSLATQHFSPTSIIKAIHSLGRDSNRFLVELKGPSQLDRNRVKGSVPGTGYRFASLIDTHCNDVLTEIPKIMFA